MPRFRIQANPTVFERDSSELIVPGGEALDVREATGEIYLDLFALDLGDTAAILEFVGKFGLIHAEACWPPGAKYQLAKAKSTDTNRVAFTHGIDSWEDDAWYAAEVNTRLVELRNDRVAGSHPSWVKRSMSSASAPVAFAT